LRTLLLRDTDTALSLDQRASATNATHPAIYVCLHAASQGTGVRLYSALMPVGSEGRGVFLDWDTAQAAFASNSQLAQSSLASEFQKKQIPVRSLSASLRPLNNITAAAVAIEVAPPAAEISALNSADYQQSVAEAITNGILAMRDKLTGGAP
jgi:N-acetylmuramoyl-L-alanine amidase